MCIRDRNYIQNGHVITVTTPAGGITSGEGLIVGSIFGVAAYTAAEGDPLEPVSYTHLDVYKRQVSWSSPTPR